MIDERPDASCYVTAAVPTTIRSRNLYSVYKAGVGIFHLIWPLGKALRAGEYDFKVTAINAAGRIVQLGNDGTAAAPGGAGAPAGSTSLQILIFDAAGAAADADFLFTAERA